MKNFQFCKRTVSLILAVIMLMSMMTVGIVATSAASVDAAASGDGQTSINMESAKLYYSTTTNSSDFTEVSLTCSSKDYAYVEDIELTGGTKYYFFYRYKEYGWGGFSAMYANNGISLTSSNNLGKTLYLYGSDDYNATCSLTTAGTTSQKVKVKFELWTNWDGSNNGNASTKATQGSPYGGTTPTQAPTQAPTGDTRTITIGVVSHIGDPQNVRIYYWGGATSADATPVSLNKTEQFTVAGTWQDAQTYNLYSVTIPADATKIKVHWASGVWDNDECDVADGKAYLVYNYSGNHLTPVDYSSGSTDPEDPDEPGETVRVYFVDSTSTSWINGADANMFVRPSGSQQTVKMTETVDITTGKNVWYADVKEAGRYYFYRCSYFFDESNASTKPWNTWDATSRGSNITYNASGSGSGSWDSTAPNIANAKDYTKLAYGLWVDAKGAGDTLDAVKWYKKDGSNYHLYLPSYTNISAVNVYTSISGLKISGNGLSNKALSTTAATSVALQAGKTYTLSGGLSGNLTVYQTTSTAALMLTTNETLWTGTLGDALSNSNAWPADRTAELDNKGWVSAYKEAISTKGKFLMYDESGKQINSDTGLKKLKGRGNSSFEASLSIYGKYAYNITTTSKEPLIKGCEKASKWCLLANNVDVSMMRNTVIYGIADAIGVKYSPNTRLIDLFDNGNYLGAYVMTEKVEYGKNTLMPDMNSLDKINEKIVNASNEPVDIEAVDATQTTYRSGSTNYQCKYYDVTAENVGGIEPNFEKGNFLLEHELFNRYQAELSWFVSGRTGQAVVVKYPEYCTKGEMEWIIDQYEAMESAVYDHNSDYSGMQAVIDTNSFAKMYLIQELANNLDSGATSYYIYNDLTTGKLAAAPVWDYDWALGSYYGDHKYIIQNGQVKNAGNIDDPYNLFIRNKALKTDGDDNTKKNDFNLQAKMIKNNEFWSLCREIYTNQLVDQLFTYTKRDNNDTGIIWDELYTQYESSMKMNDARWGAVNFTGDTWGTKITTNYGNYYSYNSSSDLAAGQLNAGNFIKSYDNAVAYLNDWICARTNAMSNSSNGNYYNSDLIYEISGVTFTATLDGDQLTVNKPTAATAKKGNANLSASDLVYNVYVDGTLVKKAVSASSVTITLEVGTHDVYVELAPANLPDLTTKSDDQTFAVAGEGTTTAAIYFKSSDSYRYIPSVVIDGVTYTMTKSGTSIGHNSSFTQKYYWYTADVIVNTGAPTALSFTNTVGMGATVTVTYSGTEAMYFGADNLNNATTAVDLTNATETVRNFVKSATHMLKNDARESGLATTSLNGTIYKMGDADQDNALTIMDVTAIQRKLALITDLSETGEAVSDFDLDETLSITDGTMIQLYLVNN